MDASSHGQDRSGEYVVSRWRRYGADRLYVTALDGTRVGYWNLLTHEPHPASLDRIDELMDAVLRWHAATPVTPARRRTAS